MEQKPSGKVRVGGVISAAQWSLGPDATPLEVARQAVVFVGGRKRDERPIAESNYIVGSAFQQCRSPAPATGGRPRDRARVEVACSFRDDVGLTDQNEVAGEMHIHPKRVAAIWRQNPPDTGLKPAP